MKYLIFALIFVSSPVYSLAPPPVNFTREIVEIEGKKYEIKFDGKKIEIEEAGIPMETWTFWLGLGIYSWSLILIPIFYSWKKFFLFLVIGWFFVYLLSRPVVKSNKGKF